MKFLQTGNRAVTEGVRVAAARAEERIVRKWGRDLDITVGCGYPKSGTVWLCKLLSAYLSAPYPQNYLLPTAMRSVVHAHWDYNPDFPKTAYIVRDGRDAMISLYHHQMRVLREGRNPRQTVRLNRKFMSLFGKDFDPFNLRANLPTFLEAELTRPSVLRRSWAEHVREWTFDTHENVAIVRYEDLLARPVESFEALLGNLLSTPVNHDFARMAVERYDFARVTGRNHGQEDVSSFQRKGVAGEWQEWFTADAAEIFQELGGDCLVRHGYETSSSWTRHCLA